MHVQEARGAGAPVQVVHVLRHQEEAAGPAPVQLGQREVRGVGPHGGVGELGVPDRLIADMVKVIYRETDPRLHGAAALSVLAHLEDLVARGMVTKYGMSDALGTMVYADDKDSGFGLQNKTISEATQQKVDAEIRRILDEQYAVAHRILEDKRSVVEAMTAALLEWETIDAEQVKALMEGRTPSPPPGWVAKPPAGGGKDDSSTPTAPVLVDPAPQI